MEVQPKTYRVSGGGGQPTIIVGLQLPARKADAESPDARTTLNPQPPNTKSVIINHLSLTPKPEAL